MVDARLPDGSRVNAIIPPLSLRGPTLTIRKFSRDPYSLADLAAFGALTPASATFLAACVRGKVNVLISGGTGSGKTTLLNALSGFIPGNERIVTIEDAAELQLQQRHVVSLEARPPNIEGEGEVRIRELVRNALRMRPDRIIVGEVRGPETLDMLQAMNTGHEGSLTTIHANTPRDALHRLEMLVLMAGVELPLRAVREQIASAFDLIIHLVRLVDGSRRVSRITEVSGLEGDIVTLQDLFVTRSADDDGIERRAGRRCSGRSARPGCGRTSSRSSPRTASRSRTSAFEEALRLTARRLTGATAALLAAARRRPGARGRARGTTLRRVDSAGYPVVQLVVRSSDESASPDGVRERAAASPGVEAQNLGRSKAIVLAIDRSTSMARQRRSTEAARGRAAVPRAEAALRLRLGGDVRLDRDRAVAARARRRSTPTPRFAGSRATRVEGTALYDAVVVASVGARRSGAPGARARAPDRRPRRAERRDARRRRSAPRAARTSSSTRSRSAHAVLVPAQAARRGHGRRLLLEPDAGRARLDLPADRRRARPHVADLVHDRGAARATRSRSRSDGRAAGESAVLPGRHRRPGAHARAAGAARELDVESRARARSSACSSSSRVRQLQLLPRAARVEAARVGAHRPARPDARPRERSGDARRSRRCSPTLDRRLRGVRRWDRIEQLVETAAVPVRPAAILGRGASRSRSCSRSCSGWRRGSTFIALLAFVAGLIAPFAILRVRATRRVRRVRGAAAGRARDRRGLAARRPRAEGRRCRGSRTRASPPISTELRRVLAEARLGRPLEEALVAMCERLALGRPALRRDRGRHPEPGRRLARRRVHDGRRDRAAAPAAPGQRARADRDGPRVGGRALVAAARDGGRPARSINPGYMLPFLQQRPRSRARSRTRSSRSRSARSSSAASHR